MPFAGRFELRSPLSPSADTAVQSYPGNPLLNLLLRVFIHTPPCNSLYNAVPRTATAWHSLPASRRGECLCLVAWLVVFRRLPLPLASPVPLLPASCQPPRTPLLPWLHHLVSQLPRQLQHLRHWLPVPPVPCLSALLPKRSLPPSCTRMTSWWHFVTSRLVRRRTCWSSPVCASRPSHVCTHGSMCPQHNGSHLHILAPDALQEGAPGAAAARTRGRQSRPGPPLVVRPPACTR